jgi:hypothetical protein
MDTVAEIDDHCTWMMDQFFGMVLPLRRNEAELSQ